MEEIKVSEMLQAESINKDDSVMIIQEGVNKKASGSIQTATGTSLSLTSVADTCKVTSNSKNIFDGKLELGTYSDAGAPSASSTNYRNVNKIKVEPETTYTFSINGTSQKYAVYYYNASEEFISAEGLTGGTFTTPASCYFVNFRCFNADYTSDYANLKLQLEQGSTATSYNPYNTEVGIGVEELQLEDGSLQGSDGQPISTENRRRSANFIEIDATKQHIITTGSYQLSVYQYKADGTYLESSQGWQNSPYTLTPNAQTGKIKIVIPNSNAKVYDISIDDIKPQIIYLTPNEEKSVFTYDNKTIVEGNGSVTIEYNTQSRLLNNDDTTAIKEYVDRIVEEKSQDTYSTEEIKIGTYMGKPLYRKVFVINATIPSNSTSSSGSVTIFDKSTYKADEVFIKSCRVDNSDNSVSIYIPYAGGQPRYIGISRISNNINISFYNAFSNENVKITSIIEYTKTTDA